MKRYFHSILLVLLFAFFIGCSSADSGNKSAPGLDGSWQLLDKGLELGKFSSVNTSEPFESNQRNSKSSIGFDAGFVNMTSMGFLVGSSHNAQVAPFSLLMVNGYRTPVGLFAGFGTGAEFFSTTYMPFFLDLRYDILGTDVVPYVVAKGGYGIPLASDRSEYDYTYEYFGGPLFGAGVGLKIRTRKHFAWDIELMYRYQETSYTESYDWNNQEYEYTDIFNRIEIRLGFYID